MKKLLAIILALLTLTSTACAETLRLYQMDVTDDFKAAHPDVEIITHRSGEQRISYNGMELNNALLSGGFPWDVFETYTMYTDLQLLYQKGYLLDLSSSEIISDFVARLYPDIAAQCMYDGKIYGVPLYIGYKELPMMVWHEMWEDAGYTQADLPQTFGEYLDFIDAWLDRREDEPDLTLNVVADYTPYQYSIHSYPGLLVDDLLDNYMLQHLYAGDTLRFDDPDLIPLLEKAKTVGERIFTYEPTKTDYNSNYGLFMGAGHELEYAELKEWQVDLRIHEDQPTLMNFFLTIGGIYAGTEHPELAIAALEDHLLNWMEEDVHQEHIARMCMDGEPVRNPQFESQMRLSQNIIEMCERRLAGDDTPYTDYVDMTDLDYYQGSVARLAAELPEMKDADVRDKLAIQQEGMERYKQYEYVLSPENLAVWQQYAQHLYFPGPNVFTTDEGYENFRSLKSQFVNGLIDARQLVNELDRIAWMMEMENQ